MMAAQTDLFGMPLPDPDQSQYFTPAWLARLLAEWVPPTARVIEPSAGSGNLVDALIRRGHDPRLITAVELDVRWVEYLAERFPLVRVIHGNFLDLAPVLDPADCVLMNPPFEDNTHMRFVVEALRLASAVVGVFPVTFESTQERDAKLWAPLGRTVRRAWLPERVDYGAEDAPSFESVALKIGRRDQLRGPEEIRMVAEEAWRRSAA